MSNDRYSFRHQRTFHRLMAAACGLLFVLSGQLAQAQSFTWDKIDPAFEKLTARSAAKGLIMQIVIGKSRLSSNREAFDDWYRKYLFPAMASPESMGEVYENRDMLFKDLERATDAATHQALLDLAYDEAVKRATGNYHPAVRFNALLIIGNLNQVEVQRKDRLPPIRLPKAFDFLLSEYQKPDQLDVLRMAAMLGLERHLQLVKQRPQDQPIPDAKKAEVVASMKALAEEKTVPDGREEGTHTWLRRRSIDLLAAVGQVGDGQSTFNTLVAIVDDPEEPLTLRCTAARAIGDLNYTDVTGVDAVVTAHKIGALVAHACRDEDTWVKDTKKQVEEAEKRKSSTGYPGMAGGYAGSGGGGYPGMEGGGGYPGMESEYPSAEGESESGYGGYGGYGYGAQAKKSVDSEPIQELTTDARRRLKLPIYCAQLGIRGEMKKSYGSTAEPALGAIAQLASDDAQKGEIQKILTSLDNLITATDSIDEGLEEMMTQVRAATRELEAILPQPAEEAQEEAVESALPGADLPGGGGATKPPPPNKSKAGKSKTGTSKAGKSKASK